MKIYAKSKTGEGRREACIAKVGRIGSGGGTYGMDLLSLSGIP